MSQNYLSSIQRITTGFLDTVNDATPGNSVAGTAGLDSSYAGQLGALLVLSHAEAAKMGKNVTLYGGSYQYVRFKAGFAATPAQGLVLYWDDPVNYVVTPDAPTSGARIAGFMLGASNSPGNYGFMQRDGVANVLYKNAITKASPVIDDLVVATVSANTADILADATAIVSPNLKLVLGVAMDAPVSNAVSRIQVTRFFSNC